MNVEWSDTALQRLKELLTRETEEAWHAYDRIEQRVPRSLFKADSIDPEAEEPDAGDIAVAQCGIAIDELRTSHETVNKKSKEKGNS